MKNLKTTFLIAVIFLLAAHFSARAQTTTNVRGKITISNGQPAVSARIDLYYYNQGDAKWLVFASTYTDSYGFYYFKNVPVGYYSIQVNQSKNFPVQVIAIDARRFVYQDFPLFTI